MMVKRTSGIKATSESNSRGPFLDRVAVFVTYEEIYGEKPTYDQIVGLIASLPTEFWLRRTSIGEMFVHHFANKHDHQGTLANYWLPKEYLKLDAVTEEGSPRYLFHSPQLLALMRLALIYSSPGKMPDIDDDHVRDITARTLLGVTSLLDVARRKSGIDRDPVDVKSLVKKLTFDVRAPLTVAEKNYIMSFLYMYHDQIHEHLPRVFGRFKDMLFDIPKDIDFNPQGHSKVLIEDVLRDDIGITLSQYAALTFGLLSKYLSTDDIFKKEFQFAVDKTRYFLNTSIRPEIIDFFFDEVAQSQNQFIGEEQSKGNLPEMINDFQFFMTKPLICANDSDQYYPVSLTYLQRLLHIGFPWVISRGRFREDVRNYWGHVFEFYCHKLCKRIERNSATKPKYFRELPFGSPDKQQKSCDAILVYGHEAVLLEFKVKDLHLNETLIKGSFDSFVRDINQAFIGDKDGDKAAKQIDDTIRAIRIGDLNLPGVDTMSIRNYFPVVVLLQAWPLGPLVYEFIRKAVFNSRCLRQSAYIAPLEIWSCEEFESIEALVTSSKPKSVHLPEVIRQKVSGPYSDLHLSTFLYDVYDTTLLANSYVHSRMDEMFEIVLEALAMKDLKDSSDINDTP